MQAQELVGCSVPAAFGCEVNTECVKHLLTYQWRNSKWHCYTILAQHSKKDGKSALLALFIATFYPLQHSEVRHTRRLDCGFKRPSFYQGSSEQVQAFLLQSHCVS